MTVKCTILHADVSAFQDAVTLVSWLARTTQPALFCGCPRYAHRVCVEPHSPPMAKDPHTRGQECNGVSPQIETQLRKFNVLYSTVISLSRDTEHCSARACWLATCSGLYAPTGSSPHVILFPYRKKPSTMPSVFPYCAIGCLRLVFRH